MRRFELVEGSSGKFWEINVEGDSYTVRFGKLGTAGQTQTKAFDSPDAAMKAADKVINEKTKKGYVETGDTAAPAAPPAARPALKDAAPKPEPSPGDSFESLYRGLLDLAAMGDSNATIPPGASAARLAEIEEALGVQLPADVKTLFSVSDGPSSSLLYADGFLSTEKFLEQWRMHYAPPAPQQPSTEDRHLFPLTYDNGVVGYLIGTPGAKYEGAIATWDNDGEGWGDTSNRVAPSLRALLEKQEAKALKRLPKGFPRIPGFAFGALPEPAIIESLTASLAAKKGSFENELESLSDNAPVGKALIESLMRHPTLNLFAHDAHHEQVEAFAEVLDIDVVLAALDRFTASKTANVYAHPVIEGWTQWMDRLVTKLIARDAAKMAAHDFKGIAKDGYAITARRLGIGPALSSELQRRIASECTSAPHEALRIEGAGTVLAKATGDSFEFALGPLFDSVTAYRQRLIQYMLEPASVKRVFPRALIHQALKAATPEEMVIVIERGNISSQYDLTPGRDNKAPVFDTLVKTIALLPDTDTEGFLNLKKVYAVFAAYLVALEEERPLPDLDGWWQHAKHIPNFFEKSFATDSTWSKVVAAMGSERVKTAFARYPLIAAGEPSRTGQ